MGKRCVKCCLCRHKKNKSAYWLDVCESGWNQFPLSLNYLKRAQLTEGCASAETLFALPARLRISSFCSSYWPIKYIVYICKKGHRQVSGPGAARTLLLCVTPVLLVKDSREGRDRGRWGMGAWLEKGVSDRETVRDTYRQGESARQTVRSTENQREGVRKWNKKRSKEKEKESPRDRSEASEAGWSVRIVSSSWHSNAVACEPAVWWTSVLPRSL